jgi:hypothetical protein
LVNAIVKQYLCQKNEDQVGPAHQTQKSGDQFHHHLS